MQAGSRRTPEDALLALVHKHAAELLRFARRHSLCDDDAQDAYQRGLEMLVRRMDHDPPREPLKWLRTILKHEARALRTQRRELVGRAAADLDEHEARHLEDPAERVVAFERLRHTAEAAQRLKQAELRALLQRAEGLTYKEIAARNGWTYTKVNRAITEGRRALRGRLGAIESGRECRRWLPLLSRLADGEASADERARLRPHLRACPGCRATLRELHDAPQTLAALVPPALALGAAAARPGAAAVRHAEDLLQALLARTAVGIARVQSALDALPGAKLAAVAASGAALAGGGIAISQTALAPARPAPRHAATEAAAGALPARAVLGALAPYAALRAPQHGAAGEFAATSGEFAPAPPAREFGASRPAAGGRSAPEFATAADAPAAGASAGAQRARRPGGRARVASAAAAPLSSQPRAPESAPPAAPAEFAGP
jgi:RNA polymerase sigma factor (sigma-70 family)